MGLDCRLRAALPASRHTHQALGHLEASVSFTWTRLPHLAYHKAAFSERPSRPSHTPALLPITELHCPPRHSIRSVPTSPAHILAAARCTRMSAPCTQMSGFWPPCLQPLEQFPAYNVFNKHLLNELYNPIPPSIPFLGWDHAVS